jgi:hypothetical protein
MSFDIQGVLTSFQMASETTTVLVPYLREIFVNEAPIFARTPHIPIAAPEYNITSYDVRSRSITLGQALTAVAGYTVQNCIFSDVSQMQVGDVLEVYNTAASAYERMEVQADPVLSTNTVSVMRGVENTTPIANDFSSNAASFLGYIIGNSRTGAETNQTAFRSIRSLTPQYLQTYQTSVQVGGLTQAISAITLPPGISDVFSLEQKTKMTEFVRDVEYSSYYGIGQSASVGGVNGGAGRRKQAGLRKLIGNYKNGLNVRLGTGSSYTKLQFVADGVQKCLNGGGNPDILMVSLDFGTTGLSTWSFGQQEFVDPKATPYLGIMIEEFLTSITGQPMTVIPSFQLRSGTAACLTSKDIKMRRIREAFFQKRGIRGDEWEGDFIGDYCCELGHPGWHSWIEGISGYA